MSKKTLRHDAFVHPLSKKDKTFSGDCGSNKTITALEQKVKRLRVVIKGYARHHLQCGFYSTGICDCGLIKTLKALKDTEGE